MRGQRCALAVAGLLLAACADASPGTVHLYDRAPVPAVPDRTAVIDPSVTGAGADGQYWAELIGWDGGDPAMVTFRLTQAFFADTCIQELGADACTDGYGTRDEPNRTVDAPVADLAEVTVVGANHQNFAITGQELLALAGGAPPSTDAPADIAIAVGELPFLLTVRGGAVVEAHQIWVP